MKRPWTVTIKPHIHMFQKEGAQLLLPGSWICWFLLSRRFTKLEIIKNYGGFFPRISICKLETQESQCCNLKGREPENLWYRFQSESEILGTSSTNRRRKSTSQLKRGISLGKSCSRSEPGSPHLQVVDMNVYSTHGLWTLRKMVISHLPGTSRPCSASWTSV